MLLKKCNYEIDLPNNLDFDSIKDIKVFSKTGSLITDVSREILREIFIQVKKLEKEKERKGELQNGREITRSNEESNSRGQNNDRNDTDRLGDRIFRGRGNGIMVSNVRDREGSGDRTEPSALWNDVERVPIREQTPRDNNVSNDRGTQQENVRDTGNGRELQGQNSERIVGETTNATVRQDTRESITSSTYTSNSRGDDNQGYNRESSINNIEETQEPNKDLGSFSIEEKSIENIQETIEETTQEDMLRYVEDNVGKEIEFEDSNYLIYRVNELFNQVSLTLANGGYPIFREESVETIYNALKSQVEEQTEEKEQAISRNAKEILTYEELDEENQVLFNEVKLNFLRQEKIDGNKILDLIQDVDTIQVENTKEFFKDLDLLYYDENLGINIQIKSNENGLIFINEDVKVAFSYNEINKTINDYFQDGIYDNYIDNIGDYNIPDEIEEMVQEISNEEIFENEYYDNEITEDFTLDNNIEETQNYVYSEEHNLYDGGVKTRARKNIEIITLLKKIEQEDRQATQEEQKILASYNGFGGLANALANKVGFEEEYQTFKKLLTEDEFKSARKSTTTAFYTDPKIVQAMYKALDNFGFEQGKILDPSMGTGNFFSVLPKKMKNSTLYGVELDSITGRIARQLYPNSNISIQGFEETNYPNNYFDVAMSNIPFNNLQVNDPIYNEHNFKIHDYFIAKMIDKVKQNGIVGIIATKGVLDKKDSSLREYVNERAELVGAIRLPNNAFKQIANTDVTTDIIFFQKRESPILEIEKNTRWLNISEDKNGIPINNYFIDNPQMVLGEMVFDKSMYGAENLTACKPFENANLYELLDTAINSLKCTYKYYKIEHQEEIKETINIDNNIKNLSYGVIDNEIYYKENNELIKQDITGRKAERLTGLIGINEALRDIIDFQTKDEIIENYTTEQFNNEIQNKIQTLNERYDKFVSKNGYINDKTNISLFRNDISFPLLTSIEKEVNGKFEKTDIFYKPTIKIKSEIQIENAEDCLKVCLNDLGRVDIEYMSKLYNKSKDEVIEELGNKIFQDPILYNKDNIYIGYVTADEYLTGYVKDKLAIAREKARELPIFEKNVKALEKVQPIPLKPSEIGFSLGSTWIPPNIYKEFIDELLDIQGYSSDYTQLNYLEQLGEYHIEGKNLGGTKVNETYGTKRMNALVIIENTLNLKPIRINDKIEELDKKTGELKTKYILNHKETILAKSKQEEIKNKFEEFIIKDEKRLEYLTNIYNEKFNNFVNRKYNGSNLELPNISKDIILRDYQKDVIARTIYSNSNVLIAHEVGAGKTFSAIASVYEQKRLGIVKKPLIVVPNHLTKQWGNEFLRLYPNANILVARKSDFEKENRQRFISKIATNDFDAIIMSHSSFEKIGISKETRLKQIETEIKNITKSLEEISLTTGKKNNWSVKKLEIVKNNLEIKYNNLYNEKSKDKHLNFDELGVDCLVIDESHRYKNREIYTKMDRVAGINTSKAEIAMSTHLKAQYISNLNGGKGVIYLTGTPITNSMSELYVLQNTLQPKDLEKKGINSFDKWVSTFGIVEETDEIKPEGTGYQKKMRLSKFHNLPELMKMFNNIADVKTTETLNLPRPSLKTGKEQIIKAELTEDQKLIIDLLVDRAEEIRRGNVNSEIDNFLNITRDARLLSVDPRILDNEIPYNANTKLNLCARKVAEIYHETIDNKSTQLIFCDLGVPKDKEFNFYDALKKELLENGVSKDEIAYIHNAKTDEQKEKLFEKVRNGEIRVLIGSTERMGVGTNVQDKLYALHNLDIPWRPDQLTQRNGRILRQGNENKEVEIFNYITEGSFDSYLYQILENKQKFISQVMTEKSPLRVCDDIDEVVLNYAEIKGLAMKNPFMKEKMQVETEINKLNLLKGNWLDTKERYKDKIEKLPLRIEKLEISIRDINLDIETYKNNKPTDFEITLNNIKFNDRAKAGEYFMELKSKLEKETNTSNMQEIGSYGGLKVGFTTEMGVSKLYLIGNKTYEKELGISSIGNMTRLENLASDIESQLPIYENRLNEVKKDLENSKEQINKPFEYDERLAYLIQRKVKIDYNIENGITQEINQEDLIVDDNQTVEHNEIKEPIKIEETEKSINDKDNNITEPTKIDINQDKLSKELYNRLYYFGKEVLDGKEDYLVLKSNGFDDLVLEKIDSNEYSLAHYSTLNGDAMRSPEITFKVEDKNIIPTSYLDDYLGDYQDYEEIKESPKLLLEIKGFFNSWLKNIAEQFKNAIENLKTKEDEIQSTNIVKETKYEEKVVVENNFYDEKNMSVEQIREMYPKGTVIMLENMQGENMPKGLVGFVKSVDDKGQIQMLWQNGSSLALNVKVDKFTVLGNEQNNNRESKEVEQVVDYEQDMEEI